MTVFHKANGDMLQLKPVCNALRGQLVCFGNNASSMTWEAAALY